MTDSVAEIDVQEALGTLDQKFDANLVNQIECDLSDALKQIATKYGLKVGAVKSGYNSAVFGFNAEFKVRMINGMTPEQREFHIFASHPTSVAKGMKKEWFGMNFFIGRTMYTVVGVNRRKPTNCIRVQKMSDKKIYSCSINTILYSLRKGQ